MTNSVASLSVCCLIVLVLLLPAPHGASSHTSHELGSGQFFPNKTHGKSSGNSQQASTVSTATTTSSSSIATGLLGNNKLPIVHQQSPCSPLHGLPSLTAADGLHHDASLIRRRFSSKSSPVAPPASSLAVTIIPTNGSSDPTRKPVTLQYSVLVSYGTPEQQFPVLLDTSSIGMSLLRCKPCASGSDDCHLAFDTSRSSTFAHVLCGSPDCPTNCSGDGDGDSFCPLDSTYSIIDGAFAEDVLTLAPSSKAIENFRFVCLDVDEPDDDLPVAGTLDLSRDRNSLPSQLSSSPGQATAAFSYCLPKSPSSQGYLSLAVDATVRHDKVTAHAPLVSNGGDPELASMYFIDLVGMSLGVDDIPIPPAGSFGNNGVNLDLGTTFTKLTPEVYMTLRDSFRKQMSQNNHSLLGFDGFDTCFNLTGVRDLAMPLLWFKFSNGERLLIDLDQMLYYDDPAAAPFTMACLAFSSLDAGDSFSAVIGTHTLASTEVIYDVAGGKVGFIPRSC
ncbi:aspartyl protease AED1 [Sorghum bicolor]|uniref:Peptidase A1 domain-containing protein n=1 Tax=Sorghum bicolor TaxID=4558 RepID=A0A1Z5R7G7_SORBI|nr:aspartyl protease AED1 [Sorghum bicolor]OQU79708.1 hypothetical protein SORBI_3008G184700 [Sorghum bicolor]|eukprot:XP_002443633.1 aspartyl protease AED1 [Sorghum bicolor]